MIVDYLGTEGNNIKVNKAERLLPGESAECLTVLSGLFEGWVPADLASAVTFRGQASSMQMSGPTAYVAGLLGEEDRWKNGLVQVWNAMPPSKLLQLPGL